MLINRIIEISKYKNEEVEAVLAVKLILTLLEGLKVMYYLFIGKIRTIF